MADRVDVSGIEQSGRRAYDAGIPVRCNPFSKGSDARAAWNKGWRDACGGTQHVQPAAPKPKRMRQLLRAQHFTADQITAGAEALKKAHLVALNAALTMESYEAAAKYLGINVGTYKSRLSRARSALSKAIGGET